MHAGTQRFSCKVFIKTSRFKRKLKQLHIFVKFTSDRFNQNRFIPPVVVSNVQADEGSDCQALLSIRARLEEYFTVSLRKLLENVHGFAKRESEHGIQITASNCRKMRITGRVECKNKSPRLKYPDVWCFATQKS